jgi:hypothetical protein
MGIALFPNNFFILFMINDHIAQELDPRGKNLFPIYI